MNVRSLRALAVAVVATATLVLLVWLPAGHPVGAQPAATEVGRYILFSPHTAGGGRSVSTREADLYKIDTLTGRTWVLKGKTWSPLSDT